MPEASRFRGSIAGIGTTSGVRIVVGSWAESPYGPFTDVMLAEPDGTRRLLAPTAEVAAYVSGTYSFDDVRVVPVVARLEGRRVHVVADELDLDLTVGRRTALGHALCLVPRGVATAPWWSRITDPVAVVLLRGVRTRGSAGGRRTEVYGATDHHAVETMSGTWRGRGLGALAPVAPDPRFGFGSTPERPSVTTLVTTVVERAAGPH